jgi:hypothetical protein
MPPYRPVEERFWEKVDRSGGCWEWTGATVRGYGCLRTKGKTEYAHRLVLELGGVDTEGWKVCHHCDNPLCVRPLHLFLGTDADNADDMKSKGRQRKGESKPNAVLTESDVRDIRRMVLSGHSQRKVAAEYSMNQGDVSRIVRGLSWAHVK